MALQPTRPQVLGFHRGRALVIGSPATAGSLVATGVRPGSQVVRIIVIFDQMKLRIVEMHHRVRPMVTPASPNGSS